MDSIDIILKYFPTLTDVQKEQLEAIGPLYEEWNARINVVSRKDIHNLYAHHVLHSLSIAKFITPVEATTMLDLGCGGGFPGIPLAILWPHVRFHLIDRIGKKIKVAQAVANAIGLTNTTFQHGDAGECHEKFDFVVSRAVMNLEDLIKISKPKISHTVKNKWPNGLICLKGGDLDAEMSRVNQQILEIPLSDYFSEDYYRKKSLIFAKL